MSFERIKKVNGHEYKYLVENVRDKESGKVKQKIIKYIGRVDKSSKPEIVPEVKIPEYTDDKENWCDYKQPVKIVIDRNVLDRLISKNCCGFGINDVLELMLNRDIGYQVKNKCNVKK